MPAAKDTTATDEGSKIQTRWTFHYMSKKPRSKKPQKGDRRVKEYLENLNYVGSFDTVEEFWKIFSWLKSPSELPRNNRSTYYLFRANLQPAWETFPEGGCWIVKIKDDFIDFMWRELVFNVIGEMFQTPELVGITVSRRENENILTVWNRANMGNLRYDIGERLKDVLNLDMRTVVEYKFFKEAKRDGSTHANAKKYCYTPISQ